MRHHRHHCHHCHERPKWSQKVNRPRWRLWPPILNSRSQYQQYSKLYVWFDVVVVITTTTLLLSSAPYCYCCRTWLRRGGQGSRVAPGQNKHPCFPGERLLNSSYFVLVWCQTVIMLVKTRLTAFRVIVKAIPSIDRPLASHKPSNQENKTANTKQGCVF